MAVSKKAKAMAPTKPMSFSQQDVELASKVKRANQRLRELEKQGLENSPAYKAAERIALKGNYLTGTTKAGQIKFNTNIRNLSELKRRDLEREVDRFLAAETSTTKGAKAVARRARDWYRKSAQGYQRDPETGEIKGKKMNYPPVDIDDIEDDELKEWLNLWGTATAAQMKAAYGSDFTEFMINNLIASDISYDDAQQFMTDKMGQPVMNIIEDIEGVWESSEGQAPWEWSDIFAEE